MTRGQAKRLLAAHGATNRFSLRTVSGFREAWQNLTLKEFDPSQGVDLANLRAILRTHRVLLGVETVSGYAHVTVSDAKGTRDYFGKGK